MNIPVEIRVAEAGLGLLEVLDGTESYDRYDYELRVDKQTRDWIWKVQKDFAEVQEYLRSIHPDYMER